MANDKKSDDKMYTAAEFQSAIQATAKAVAEELAPVMMAVAKGQQPQAQGPAPRRATGPTCSVCGQFQIACGGVPRIEGEITKAKEKAANEANHELMVVYPTKYPEFGAWFQGRKINGVTYLSNNQGHKVWVPKDAVGDIQRAIESYEDNERETRMGRVREHNSGSINSPNKVADSGVGGWR